MSEPKGGRCLANMQPMSALLIFIFTLVLPSGSHSILSKNYHEF